MHLSAVFLFCFCFYTHKDNLLLLMYSSFVVNIIKRFFNCFHKCLAFFVWHTRSTNQHIPCHLHCAPSPEDTNPAKCATCPLNLTFGLFAIVYLFAFLKIHLGDTVIQKNSPQPLSHLACFWRDKDQVDQCFQTDLEWESGCFISKNLSAGR